MGGVSIILREQQYGVIPGSRVLHQLHPSSGSGPLGRLLGRLAGGPGSGGSGPISAIDNSRPRKRWKGTSKSCLTYIPLNWTVRD